MIVLACVTARPAVAQVGPARVEIVDSPRIGARAGEVSVLINYRQAPGIARIEVIVYATVTVGWFDVRVPVGTASAEATLPKGAWGENIGGIPSGWVVTHAAVVLRDKRGTVIGRKFRGAVVVVP